jgi:hypothetical protein
MLEPDPPREEREWGVIAYVMADQRDLSKEDAAQFDEIATQEARKLIRAARGLQNVYLSVHVDLTSRQGALRYLVPGRVGRDSVEELKEQRAGIDGLVKFVEASKREQPARHRMLILWGHGFGPLGLFADPDGGEAKQTGVLTLPDLQTALTRIKDCGKVDILLVKSCYMATLEAATELEGLTDYMICSQGLIPLRTWTVWEEVFERLEGEPRKVAEDVLQAIATHYRDVVERNERSEIPFSLLRPSGIGQVRERIAALSAALLSYAGDPTVAEAIEQARPVAGGDKALLDVRRLCSNLMASEYVDLANCASALQEAIQPALVVANTPDDSAFGGVGVFHFPRDPLLRVQSFANEVTELLYLSLDFPKTTGWGALAFPPLPV